MKAITPATKFIRMPLLQLSFLLLICMGSLSTQAQTTKKSTEKESAYQKMDGLKKADLEKAIREIEKATLELKQQDWSKIEAEIMKAKAEIEKSLEEAEITIEKENMEKALQKVKEALAQQQGKMEEQMKKAEVQIGKAKKQIDLLTQGMDKLEAEGLIKPNDSIDIDWEGDLMILNGKKQSKAISDKYRKYFKKQSYN